MFVNLGIIKSNGGNEADKEEVVWQFHPNPKGLFSPLTPVDLTDEYFMRKEKLLFPGVDSMNEKLIFFLDSFVRSFSYFYSHIIKLICYDVNVDTFMCGIIDSQGI